MVKTHQEGTPFGTTGELYFHEKSPDTLTMKELQNQKEENQKKFLEGWKVIQSGLNDGTRTVTLPTYERPPSEEDILYGEISETSKDQVGLRVVFKASNLAGAPMQDWLKDERKAA